MTKDRYILVQGRRGAATHKFSLWRRAGKHDWKLVDWGGEVIPDPHDYFYDIGFDPDAYTERELTKDQADAAIMVARSASRLAWYRYAKRIMMTGEVS